MSQASDLLGGMFKKLDGVGVSWYRNNYMTYFLIGIIVIGLILLFKR